MKKIILVAVVLIVAVLAFTIFASKDANDKMAENTAATETATTNSDSVGSSEMAVPEMAIITLDESDFSPKNMIVKAGSTVKWINKSGKTASVNSDDHPTHQLNSFLNLGEFANGSALEVVFERPGIYGYHNHRNASQNGTVTVE